MKKYLYSLLCCLFVFHTSAAQENAETQAIGKKILEALIADNSSSLKEHYPNKGELMEISSGGVSQNNMFGSSEMQKEATEFTQKWEAAFYKNRAQLAYRGYFWKELKPEHFSIEYKESKVGKLSITCITFKISTFSLQFYICKLSRAWVISDMSKFKE